MPNYKLAQVLHVDVFGKREDKYKFLTQNSLHTIGWQPLQPQLPELFFVPKNFDVKNEYDNGFAVNELFTLNNVGIVTAKDSILISDEKTVLLKNVRENFQIETNGKVIQRIAYRPFDNKLVYYDTKLVERAREKVMQHFTKGENLGLVIGRQGQVVGNMQWNLSFITNSITDFNLYYRGGGVLFPLYLYSQNNTQQTTHQTNERKPNLNEKIVDEIAQKINHAFLDGNNLVDLSAEADGTFTPINILDYIYAVLHSPTYREKYKEFLKIDFPRVPYPKNAETFWQFVKLGSKIRQIHLLESPIVNNFITQYPVDGDNVVGKISFALQDYDSPPKDGEEQYYTAVYINDTQFFGNVPLEAWEFYIGGYQPAQKWLKDRKGRTLEFDDILHYQKIIVALTETDRLMKEIYKIEIE